jgi:hypothetical protein
MNVNAAWTRRLNRLVERKTETVKMLEALMEKEESELVELERQLETAADTSGSG